MPACIASSVTFADIDWEKIGPIVFFVICALAQSFFSKLKKSAESEPTESPEQEEVQRRAREVMEEVRRRVAERNQQPSAPPEEEVSPYGRRKATVSKREYRTLDDAPTVATVPPPSLVEAAAIRHEPNLIEQLAEQEGLLKEARRKRDALRAQEKRLAARDASTPGVDDLRRILASPQELKTAFVASEILSRPLALRD